MKVTKVCEWAIWTVINGAPLLTYCIETALIPIVHRDHLWRSLVAGSCHTYGAQIDIWFILKGMGKLVYEEVK